MIRLANMNEIEQIMKIKDEAVALMNGEGNFQWDEHYPSRESFIRFIERNELYVYASGEIAVAMIVITKEQDPWYESASWSVKDNYIVLHRLAVIKEYHHKGLAVKLLEFSIDFAKKNGVDIIKADTYSRNRRMPNLFRKMGFEYVGEIYFNQMPDPYLCFELVLDKQSSLT
ncbi:MAG: GNAT family N-acetyltransferase [Clostridia bacterium]|nr:GNAT family N-acetyltransferase [Clostridia bacterium]